MPAPVQKLMNGRSGWTQAMMLKSDGSILHITSSAVASDLNNTSKNEILFNAAKLDFNRYEAEDAARQGSALMRDASMSNGAKVRLGANDVGRLTFHVHLPKDGAYTLAVNYSGIGFDAAPRANLRAGDNAIEVAGGAHALDIDYLELTPTQPYGNAKPDLGSGSAGANGGNTYQRRDGSPTPW